MRALALTIAILLAAASWTASGCSGGDRSPSSLEEGFLSYTRHESVQFGISGSATCPICTQRELTVIGMQIEVVPKNDPTHSIGLWSFGGLGTFTIPRLNAEAGSQIEILGTLFLEGSADETTISGYAESAVPEEDGGIIGVTMIFPSASAAD